MIQKPDANWGREDDRLGETARAFGGAAVGALSAASVGVARVRAGYTAVVSALVTVTTGIAALAAGVGGNLPVAMLVGCFSALLGWLAMRNFRIAFGTAPSRPVARDWDAEVTGFAGVGAAGPDAGRAARDGQGMMSGDGTAICYDRTKIFLKVVLLLLAAVPMAAVLGGAWQASPAIRFIALAVVAYGIWQVFGLLLKATDKDLTAISWNDRQIRVRALTSSCQVPWPAVESVQMQRQTFRLLRLIPIYTTYTLIFRVRHNGAARRMVVLASVLAVRSGDVMDVLRRIETGRARYARAAARGQWLDPSFPDAAAADTVPMAEPVRRTQGFETCDAAPMAPVAFGRKAT